jgi:hypothetical protein
VNDRELRSRARIAYESLLGGRAAEAEAFLISINGSSSIDPYILFLYAYASILLGHIERSIPVIERLKRHYSFMAGRELSAFIRLKSASSREDALVGYIDITSESSAPNHIRKIIARIRKTADFSYFQRTVSIHDCIPLRVYSPERAFSKDERAASVKPVRTQIKYRNAILVLSVFALLALGFLAFNKWHSGAFLLQKKNLKIDIVDKVDISDEKYPVIDKHPSAETKYIYDDETALRNDFSRSRNFVKEGRCNDAIVILNKIMLSNAQMKVRDGASFLLSYINGLEDRDLSDIPYHEIVSKQDLYRGVMLKWNCMVVSVEKRKGGTMLTVSVPDKLVKVPAYAEVFYPGEINLSKQNEITVSGIYSQMIGKDNRPYIEARKIEVK